MPDFELQDQDGKTHSLKDLQGPNGVVILFYRSADWCPYCKSQLVELEQNQGDFARLGLRVAAISYDSIAVLHDFAELRGIHFPLLSDSGSKLIRELGILNESVQKNNPYFGSPYPCLFVLDPAGMIIAKYFEDDHQQRNAFTDILTHQFGTTPTARKKELEGSQLKVVAVASASIVAPGRTVALTLDVELKPDMHVYAPGVSGYIPIEWKMKPSEATAAIEVRYPASEKLRLEAIHETVPAYRGRFRLRGLITITEVERLSSVVNSSGHFSVEGALRYQACDDRICYTPEELPLNWTFQCLGCDQQRFPVERQK